REHPGAALNAAARAKDDRAAAEIWASLIFLVGNAQMKPEEAITLEPSADLALVRGGDDPGLRASLHTNLGSVYKLAGRYDEASRHHERAIELRTDLYGSEDHRVISALGNLANVRQAQGRLEEALEMHQRVLRARIERFGAEHPDVASSHNNLGAVLHQLGRLEEAAEELARAVEIKRQLLAED